MSKSRLASALVLGALLAAANLAGLTAAAHAQATDAPTGKPAARWPPIQTQVGESWHQRPPTTNQSAIAGDARRPPTEGQVGEPWRHPQVAAEQPTVADDTRRPPSEARVGEAWRHPTSAPVPPAEPSGQPGWLIPSLVVLAAALVLAGGLALLAARRAGRRARVRHAA